MEKLPIETWYKMRNNPYEADYSDDMGVEEGTWDEED
jgi:hypothetical protein